MAILNTNEVILADSGLPLGATVVIGHNFSGVTKEKASDITMQVGFYASVDKWKSDATNRLKIKGFEGDKRLLKFTYPSNTEENIYYFFDLKLKDYLMYLFPEWDEEKLIITSTPI